MKKAITTIPAAVALGTVSVSAVSFKDIDPFFDYMNDGDELRGWFDIVFGYGDLVTMVGGYADKGTTREDVVGLSPGFDLIELSGSFALLYAACENGYADSIKQALEEDWDLQAKAMTGDKKRVIKYARFYREVQKIYPALSRRLALPPGESTEREFKEVGNRAELSVSKVQRQIDLMTRDERDWIWVKVSDL